MASQSFPIHRDNTAEDMKRAIDILLDEETDSPVILCVGTDRLTGDSLGPLVGYLLTDVYRAPAFVYGTLQRTVTAVNLSETLSFLRMRHGNKKILVIDASLGRSEDIGTIRVSDAPLAPGSASGKNLPSIGDFSITAIVNRLDTKLLSTTKLGFVFYLAQTIAAALSNSLSHLHRAVS